MPRKPSPPPKKSPRKPLPEELARDAIAHEDTTSAGKVKLTFRVVLAGQDAEALAARAVRKEKNLETLGTQDPRGGGEGLEVRRARLAARWRGVCAALVGLAILGGCSSSPLQTVSPRVVAEAPPAPPSTTVSIQFVNNKILVPVVLNGNVWATFLLDTGANTTVITPTLAARLGIPLSGAAKQRARIASGQEVEVSFIRLKSVGIGTARIADFGVVVYDLPTLVPGVTPRISAEGLLGADFVARFTMTLAPRAGTLTLQLDDGPVR